MRSVTPHLAQCIVTLRRHDPPPPPQQKRDIALVLFQCWASVAGDGPPLNQHMLNVPSLLGALPRMSDLRQRCPCKHETLIQCWAAVGPTSATLAQHQPSIGSMSRACSGPP